MYYLVELDPSDYCEESPNMIGWLKGSPVLLNDRVIVKVGDVGYELLVGDKTLRQCQVNETIEVFVAQVVRENEISLYGFLDADQKLLFEKLLNISGIGPKTSLHLTDFGRNAISQAVSTADISFFTAIPRVGKKLAQKIIIELKGKLAKGIDLDLQDENPQLTDVRQALQSLGYDERDIQTALHKIEDSTLPLDTLIKSALKTLHR
jgi:holliday junction DNA helicase RuvA